MIVERIGAAAIRHVQDIDARPILQHLDAQVGGGAKARRAVGKFARIGLGILDHFFEGLRSDRRMHGKAGDEIADPADRQKALGIVGGLTQAGQHAERCIGREQEGVAVGRRLGRSLGADHATGAAAVLNDELLSETLRELLGPGTADEIRAAAGSIGQDQFDGLVGPILHLGHGFLGKRGRQCRTGESEKFATTHSCSSLSF